MEKSNVKRKRFVRKHVVDGKKESKGTPTPLTIKYNVKRALVRVGVSPRDTKPPEKKQHKTKRREKTTTPSRREYIPRLLWTPLPPPSENNQ